MKNNFITKINKVRDYLKQNERYAFPAFLMLGFLVDTITLNRVDQVFDNIVLSSYIILAGACLILIYGEHGFKNKIKYEKFIEFIPFLFLYAIGGLFSGLVILYSKSGSIFYSFPFMIILIILLIGNEFLYKKYPKLVFQSSIFYIAIFSYSILITPVLIRSIGAIAFILGSLISLGLMYLFIKLLEKYIREEFKKYESKLYTNVIGIFIIFNILYFTNIIPPVPLSLKDISIHHSVNKLSDGSYQVTSDHNKPFRLNILQETIYRKSGEPLYVFTSVFIPTKISTTISHEWSYFDSNKNRWIVTSDIPFTITGGRDSGFRGYSYKSNISNGLWKVSIKAKDGKLIGQKKFKVKDWNNQIETTPEIVH